MTRMLALRVRRGDAISDRGRRREVKAVRSGRGGFGGPAVVLIFKSGPALRVNATDMVKVERGGRGSDREERR